MALRSSVPFSAVEKIYEAAGDAGASRWLATFQGRPHVPAALTFAASHMVDEQLMFFLLAKAYELRPSRDAMLWIYQRFVKPPKVDSKATVNFDNFNDTSRTVNIASAAADRTFELVTGAWARTMAGGAHPRAFQAALGAIANMLTDIDNRFRDAVNPRGVPRKDQYVAYAMRVRLLEEELQKARQFNLQVT